MMEVPQRLTAEQKQLLEKFAQISVEEVSSPAASFKEKIKKVFK
jgi:DnaJ-class molecular chaperone